MALYSVLRSAFLRNDLSLHEVPVPLAGNNASADGYDFIETLPSCLWLCIPVPLKSEEGRADGYYSVTALLHWGHVSAVFLTEHSGFREPSVVKSLPCALSPAIRRVDGLLYEADMPGHADSSAFLCPVHAAPLFLQPISLVQHAHFCRIGSFENHIRSTQHLLHSEALFSKP